MADENHPDGRRPDWQIAEAVGKNPAAVRQIAHRARSAHTGQASAATANAVTHRAHRSPRCRRATSSPAESGSFTAAAQRENATQSGLSMQIKELEERLGVRLFDRNTAAVVPTVAGRRLWSKR